MTQFCLQLRLLPQEMCDLFWGNCSVHNVCSSMHTLHWQLVTWSNEWWKLPCGCSSLILTVIPRSWCFSAPAPGSHNDYHHESLRHTAPASFCSRHDILRYETLRKKECIWGQLNHDERHKINNDALPLMSVSVLIGKLSWNSCICNICQKYHCHTWILSYL